MSNARHTTHVRERDPRFSDARDPRLNGHGGASAAHSLRDASTSYVHLPADQGYAVARQPWRLIFDPRPAVVVEAAGPEDVRAAILTARANGLPFAVQTTGHGTIQPSDGGMLLKTSRMTGVEIDPERRVARANAGTLWTEVIAAAEPYGLAPLSGSSRWVGVAGYTLGGGAGWLSRKYGYAADAVLSARVVTAGGDVLTASADENPDLFWALRGGGGNFGVVTSLEFRLFPVRDVYAGMSFFDVARAPEAFARYREWALGEPDELNTGLILTTMPDIEQMPEPIRGKRVLILRAFYDGQAEDAERELAPLREVLGEPLMEGIRPTTFAENSADPPQPPMNGMDHFELFDELPDGAIEALIEAAGEGAEAPLHAVELRHWGGAMARLGPESGPIGHRQAPFSVALAELFDGPAERPAAEAKLGQVADELRPYATGGTFLNFLSDPARTETAYTPDDYRRLARVKATYDPDNFFRFNHNIPPGSI